MPFKVVPLDEAHLKDWSSVSLTTFWNAHPTDPFTKIFFPNGVTPAVLDFSAEGNRKALADSDQHLFRVVDTSSPSGDETVGVAKWKVFSKGKSREEYVKDSETAVADRPEKEVPGVNFENFDRFRRAQAKAKLEYLVDRPYVYLHILCTADAHQRRGVGSAALQWGIEESEKLGIPIYLESSDAGRSLYAKHGFVKLGLLPWDAREFGLSQPGTHTAMLREPRSKASNH